MLAGFPTVAAKAPCVQIQHVTLSFRHGAQQINRQAEDLLVFARSKSCQILTQS